MSIIEPLRFIDDVFGICVSESSQSSNFNAGNIIGKMYSKIEDGEQGYWQQKNVTNALNTLEHMKLINGEIKPEFTPNVRLTKEVRYGQVTGLGKFMKGTPTFMRLASYWIYLNRKSVLSVLGVLSFITLCRNAFIGIELLSGVWDYIAAAFISFAAFLGFKKIF